MCKAIPSLTEDKEEGEGEPSVRYPQLRMLCVVGNNFVLLVISCTLGRCLLKTISNMNNNKNNHDKKKKKNKKKHGKKAV